MQKSTTVLFSSHFVEASLEQTLHTFERFRRQGKDKAPSSEPVVLEDAAADEEGNPLPRVVISPPIEAVPGDNGDRSGKRKPGAADLPGQVRCIYLKRVRNSPKSCPHRPTHTFARRYAQAEQRKYKYVLIAETRKNATSCPSNAKTT